MGIREKEGAHDDHGSRDLERLDQLRTRHDSRRLFTAVRENELHFNMLHKKDKGRINFQRVCAECGKKVEWGDITKGYEHDKGEYILISDEDIKSVAAQATQSIDITEFVELADINPILFDKPYYLEPEKKGRHAYALLRDALTASRQGRLSRASSSAPRNISQRSSPTASRSCSS